MEPSQYRPILIPPEEELTELAKHYGEDNRGQLKNTKKSGVTPVDPLPPAGPALNSWTWELRKYIEATQRNKLDGFTARELKAMGAFSYFASAKPSDLGTIPLHPVFTHWESSEERGRRHIPMLPLGNGRDGYWEAHNPLVGAILTPCLQLATQFIDNCHMWTWWDTLCFGELQPIQPEKRWLGGILYSVRPRSPLVAYVERERVRQRFVELASNLTWGLADGCVNPRTGLASNDSRQWQGVTSIDPITQSIGIHLDIKKFEPLLRTDLLPADRLLLQWSIAKTAIHELAHAMWKLMKRTGTGVQPEPYFNDEVILELGFSLINHIFGGGENYVTIWGPGAGTTPTPFIAFYHLPYPSLFDYLRKRPHLALLKSMCEIVYFPVPIEYFERVQQQDFWNHHIQVFGSGSAFLGPLVHGRRYMPVNHLVEVPPRDDDQLMLSDYHGERDVIAINIENRKRLNHQIVLRTLEASIAAEQTQDQEHFDRISKAARIDGMVEAAAREFPLNPLGWLDKAAGFPQDMDEPKQYYQPDRFDEIRNFFRDHYRILALDTMFHGVPEFTFFEYINHLRKIQISKEELREFLEYANHMGILFFWKKDGLGSVWRRNKGWEGVPPKSRMEFPKPPQKHLELMEAHMSRFWVIYTARGRREIDEDLAFHYFNFWLSKKLTRAEYKTLLDWYIQIERWWARGPFGIVRCIMAAPQKVTDVSTEERRGKGKPKKD